MKWHLNFRQRIFAGFLLLSCIFILIIYPFIGWVFRNAVNNTLKKQADFLIDRLQKTSSQDQMIQLLEQTHEFLFYRVSLFNDQGEMVYDSAIQSMGNQDLSSFSLP